jgi:hypothetical protein
MFTKTWVAIVVVAGSLWAGTACATPIDIFELSAFITSPELDPNPDPDVNSLQETEIFLGLGPVVKEFETAGLGVTFDNGLGPDNLGNFSWAITNNTGGALSGVQFIAFLDAEIDEPINTFFNEFGTFIGIASDGVGPGPDSWEIDEVDPAFGGDILANLVAGTLDNMNGLDGSGPLGDVALALGFEIGDLLPGQRFQITLQMDIDDSGNLSHTDPDSDITFFFNGTTSAPEMGTLWLVAAGLAGFVVSGRRVSQGGFKTPVKKTAFG